MRNISDAVVQKTQAHILFSVTFFYPAVVKIKWKNIVEWGKPKMTVWRTRIACWIPKATNTHPHYAILIAPSPEQWLYERTSMLRNTYSTLGFRNGEAEVFLVRAMRPRHWVIGTNYAIGTKCTVTPHSAQ
jgi:hypothetical protein